MRFEVDTEQAYVYTGSRELDAAQPSVALIHGAGLDHTVWIQQSRYLAHHGFNVAALDLPGHGRSSGEPLPSIAAMAQWVGRAMSALGLERFAVVGHSMGSLVAIETAAQHPERVWHAALLGTAAPMAVAAPLLEAARADDHAAFDMINIWGHAMTSQLGGNPAPGMWMTGTAIRLLERSGPGVLFNDLDACNEYGDGIRSAGALQCPVHVVAGRRDAMTPPRAARALADAVADARVSELEGSGHMLMAERPDEVLDVLASALAEHRPAA